MAGVEIVLTNEDYKRQAIEQNHHHEHGFMVNVLVVINQTNQANYEEEVIDKEGLHAKDFSMVKKVDERKN